MPGAGVADEKSQPLEMQDGSSGRRPALAVIANLLLPPLGHLYVGAARRGLLIWVASRAVASAVPLLLLFLAPGRASILGMTVILVAATLVLPIDAFVLARRAKFSYRLRPYNRWYAYLAVAVLVGVTGEMLRQALRMQVQGFRIPSSAMTPTLLEGDFFYIDKTVYRRQKPHRGDIVVFPFPQDPTKDFVKRVIGLPDEVIEIRNKEVLVDGAVLNEPYAVYSDPAIRPAGYDPRDNFGPYKIRPRELFVMGDNRDDSNDSRYWGALSTGSIKGRALVIYWSWDGARAAVRWNRIGMRPG